MARMRRMEQAGAVFSESLSSINDLKKRGFTFSGNPTITDSPFGKCIVFDGIENVIVQHTSSQNISNKMTILIWVKRNQVDKANYESIAQKNLTTGNQRGWTFSFNPNNTFATGISASGSSASGTTATTLGVSDTTNWHLIGFSFNTGSVKYYVDNQTDTQTNAQGSIFASTANLFIGSDLLQPNTINSKNFMMFNRVLTDQEVLNIYNNKPFDYEKNVISEWDMSNINPPDVGYRKNGNNGTGVSLTAASIVNGISNDKAIYLDGSADYIDIGDITDLDNIDFSVSAWIKTSQIPAITGMIMSKKRDTGYGFFLATHTDGKARIFFNSASAASLSAYTTTAVNDGAWHHVVFTADRDGNIISYKDGVAGTPVSIAAGDGESIDNDASLRIGVGGQTFLAFNGVIDKVIIFDKVLTNLEVMDIYKKQKGGRR